MASIHLSQCPRKSCSERGVKCIETPRRSSNDLTRLFETQTIVVFTGSWRGLEEEIFRWLLRYVEFRSDRLRLAVSRPQLDGLGETRLAVRPPQAALPVG